MQEFLEKFLEEYATKFSYEFSIDNNAGLIITQYGQIGFNVTSPDDGGEDQLAMRKVEPLDDDNDDQISSLIKIKKHFTQELKKAVTAHAEEGEEEEEIVTKAPKKSPKKEKAPAPKKEEPAPPDEPVEPEPAAEEDNSDDVDSLGRKCPELPKTPPKHFTQGTKAPKQPSTAKKLAEDAPDGNELAAEDIPGTKAYGDKQRAKAKPDLDDIMDGKVAKPAPKPAAKSPVKPEKPQAEEYVDSGELVIAPAVRSMAYIKMLISSPSGGGKTLGALLLAYGLVEDWSKILIIDTENRSGSLYAGSKIDDVKIGQYQTIILSGPYTVGRYLQAIEMAEKAGIKVLVIDSLSHAWTAEGGLLDLHTKITAASRTGNSYTAWKDVTPLHAKLIEKIMTCSMHVILTARSKTEHVLTQTDKGMTPKKVGMGIVFRDGLEYEVSLAFEVDQASHVAQVTKDRTRVFADEPYVTLSPASGQKIKAWLESGEEE
jgi:hypothetical protein